MRIRVCFHRPWFWIVRCRVRVKIPQILGSVFSCSQILSSWRSVALFSRTRTFIIVTIATVNIITLLLPFPYPLLFSLILQLCLLFLGHLIFDLPLINYLLLIDIRIISIPSVSLALITQIDLLLASVILIVSNISLRPLGTYFPWPLQTLFSLMGHGPTIRTRAFPEFGYSDSSFPVSLLVPIVNRILFAFVGLYPLME